MSSTLVGLILLAVAVALVAFRLSRNASVGDIEAALKAGALVVDVRTAGEFREGHFDGAINIPLDQMAGNLKKLGDPNKPIILYCHSGMRSGSAMHIVKGGGFKKVVNAGTLGRIRSAAGGD